MTSIMTTKFTCDENGHWSEVAIVLTRKGNGWVEKPVPSPSTGAVRKEAA